MDRVLAIDLSTKSGWSLFVDGNYVDSGSCEKVSVEDFNIKDFPERSSLYPYNVINACYKVALTIQNLVNLHSPTTIVLENTVKGRCRHTQRCLEWLHFAVLQGLPQFRIRYLDPSEWRKIMDLRLNNDDKKKNRAVSNGLIKGRITKKHLAIRKVKELYGLDLLVKENDRADAILLGAAYVKKASRT